LQQADFIDGKGSGKVVLLHGPPGVGKSFTVECLAQDLVKPLLALTVADIGTDQSTIEEKLSGWLDLAQRWNAIVLIDEADAYLERRSHNELSRNALVTVFLRVLDYFPGMIVLTTNQPGFIDDAFISRLNLCIEYQEMNEDTRKKVWRQFLRKYLKEQKNVADTETKINIMEDVQTYVTSNPEIVELGLNGRDIRNAFDSAVKVATHRAQQANDGHSHSTVELKVEDFKQAVENKKAFYDYLNRVEGRAEWKRAFGRGARAIPTQAMS
jgi:SpoVK/Ycf46/Vps4 family AAA+-type ATPase